MKKLSLLFIILYGTLLLGSMFWSDTRDEPKWLVEYKSGDLEKDDGINIYFIGISQPYKKVKEKKAIQGARQNGLSQIANYINVSIGSSVKINTVDDNNNLDESIESDISSLSLVDLDSIVPSKEFLSVDGDSIVGYTLYKITKDELKEKQEEYKRKSMEYKNLIDECKEDIKNDKIDLAKDIIKKLEGFKQSKYDQEYKTLVKELDKMFNVNITTNIRKGKIFKLNEYIKVTVRPSKSVYIYVLQQYGNSKKIKMLFPNEQDNNNYLSAKKKKTLKIKTIRKHLTSGYNKIIVYASYRQIPFINHINNSYELSNKKDAKWQDMLLNIKDKNAVFQKEYRYKVDNKKKKKAIICLKVEGQGVLAHTILKETQRLFKREIKVRSCRVSAYRVNIYYDESLEYEEALNTKIRTVVFSYSLENSSDELYSSDEINQRFYAKDSKQKMMKELRADMKDMVKEMISTIKDNR